MVSIDKLGIKYKLGILVGIPLGALIILAIIGIFNTRNIESEVDTMFSQNFLPLINKDIGELIENQMNTLINDDFKQLTKQLNSADHINRGIQYLYQATIAEKMMLVSNDATNMDRYDRENAEAVAKVAEEMAAAISSTQNGQNSKFYKNFHEGYKEWQKRTRRVIELSRNPSKIKFARKSSYYGKTHKAFSNLIATLDQIKKEKAKEVAKIEQKVSQARNLVQIKQVEIEDKKGVISNLAAQMMENLRNLRITYLIVTFLGLGVAVLWSFRIANKISSTLSEVILALRDSVGQTSTIANNLAQTSGQMSTSTTEQASSIEQTSASTEEITAMTKGNKSNVESMMEQTQEMKKLLENGNKSMNTLKTAMQEILDSNAKIRELVKVIANIESKTKVMDSIVFQTKILSFNASVEAERAGEYGRGFAVVAQEVGNLAQMSGKAAHEIAEIVLDSNQKATSITDNNQVKVETGSNHVQKTAETLTASLNAVLDISRRAEMVLSAFKDQANGITQINEAMNQLDRLTQDNVKVSQETTESSRLLTQHTHKLDEIVNDVVAFVSGDQSNKGQGPNAQDWNQKTQQQPKVVV